jgi:hypothetical protein
MNKQRKVTGHGDQSKRRNRDTQPNARRDPWVRTDNHDVIARIKSIELLKQIASRVYTNGGQLFGSMYVWQGNLLSVASHKRSFSNATLDSYRIL